MTWFSKITAIASEIQSEMASSVENIKTAMPKSSDELLTALTLTTPELTAQRSAMDKEERRKEAVRDALASIFPWETELEENEVLVEECYNAIMALSTTNKTFKEDVEPRDSFPVLLRDFDLDAHVGLIQRLIAEDNNLKEMQSQFLCGGEKEKRFWKNYFYNCAIARETVGLSLDEIWDRKLDDETVDTGVESSEGVTLEKTNSVGSSSDPKPVENTKTPAKVADIPEALQKVKADESSSDSGSPGRDFEMVEEEKEDLDDLAAQIARELEE